jgi:hypothetical protein
MNGFQFELKICQSVSGFFPGLKTGAESVKSKIKSRFIAAFLLLLPGLKQLLSV